MNVPESNQASRFRDWIAEQLGLRFEDSKLDFLNEVLTRRASRQALPGPSYVAELERSASASELHALIGELTVPETYFFRHVEQYRAFGEVALPAARRARGPEHRLRVLSIGCASGEEPYSLVMWARDHSTWPIEVSALDINPAMLAKAARGVYSSWALRETPPEVQQRWFRNLGNGLELHPEIRSVVHFQQINLAHEHAEIWTPNRYDVIFCRNVLMYFTGFVAQAAVARMTQALAPHGHLFLGHAETLRGLSSEFHLCHTHNTFYYQRKESSSGVRWPAQDLPIAAPPTGNGQEQQTVHVWHEAIRDSASRIQALSDSFKRPSEPRRSASPVASASLQKAMDLLRRERFAEALELLGELPSQLDHHGDVLLLRAALLLHGGRLQDAEQVSRRLLAQDKLNSGAHYLLALCRESAGDLDGALDHDEAAIYLDSEFAMPRLHLGLMARRGGDWSGARNALDAALPLLEREDAARVLLFGGGFGREGLIALCRAELQAAESRP